MRKFLMALFMVLVVLLAGCTSSPKKVGDPAILPADQESASVSDTDSEATRPGVVFDLAGLNLVNHNLADSKFLTSVNLLGNQVIVIEEAELTQQDIGTFDADNVYAIFNDAWGIELYYFTRKGGNAVDAVVWSAQRDDAHFVDDGSTMDVGMIRASADSTTAIMSVFSIDEDGSETLLLYLAQKVPGANDYIVLDMVIYIDLLEEEDGLIMDEMSHYLGVDIIQYIRSSR